MTVPSLPLRLTSALVCAYVAHNRTPAKDLETLVRGVYHAFLSLAAGEPELKPVVAIKTSVTPDYLVCLEDGRHLKMLRRYLRARYNMTPEAYRTKWHLPLDYPMIAPNYAARRSALAKEIGLGQAHRQKFKSRTPSRKNAGSH